MPSGASMYKKDPDVIWLNGKIVPWATAVVHVTSELSTRGMNFFEGMRLYRQAKGEQLGAVALREHLDRLAATIERNRIYVQDVQPVLASGLADVAAYFGPMRDLYVRPTVYLEGGRYAWRPEDTVTGMYIAVYPNLDREKREMRCSVSPWRRPFGSPPMEKLGARYWEFRLARVDAESRGFDEAIVCNAADEVLETGGTSIFVVRGGEVVTPPLASGILPSITRTICMELLAQHGVNVKERPVHVSELPTADEVVMIGTMDEVKSAVEIEDTVVGSGVQGPLAAQLDRDYLDVCRGITPSRWLTPVNGSTLLMGSI